jgi:hypothetical protein
MPAKLYIGMQAYLPLLYYMKQLICEILRWCESLSVGGTAQYSACLLTPPLLHEAVDLRNTTLVRVAICWWYSTL